MAKPLIVFAWRGEFCAFPVLEEASCSRTRSCKELLRLIVGVSGAKG
jgi:hypothetical protein